MINTKELSNFLVKAKFATYASGDENMKIVNSDKSTTIVFEDGDWEYHDNYFGGEPYGGREVVFYKDLPVYMMVYYGKVYSDVENIGEVYQVLMNALKLISADAPYRGPKEYVEGNMIYTNKYTGDVTYFSGSEAITKDGNVIYEASYIGGLVDK
jgi:hypothetical protein